MLLVTAKERERIFEKFSKPIADSDSQVRIVDVTALAKEIRDQRKKEGASMIINIQTINFKKGKEYNKGITNVKDPEHNCYYGIFTKLDQYKNLLWSRIEMSENMQFNLNHIDDGKKWAVIRMHPDVEGSPFAMDPIFKVIDPTVEAKKTVMEVNVVQILFKQIEKMKGTELAETMRYLGLKVESTTNYEIAKSTMLKAAMNNPVAIYEKLSLKTKGIEAKIRTAISLSLVKDIPGKGIVFNETIIGLNINEAVNKLENDDKIYQAILHLIEENDIVAKNLEDQRLVAATKSDELEL